MTNLGKKWLGRSCWLGMIWLIALSPLQAASVEARVYDIFVDQKSAGSSTITIEEKDDGTNKITANANVDLKKLFVKYSWSINSEEYWSKGQLSGIKSLSSENNRQTRVEVFGTPSQLSLRVNDQVRQLPAEVWTNSYWKLAPAKFHNKRINVLEIDTGKTYDCELQFLGKEGIRIGEKMVECFQFTVTGTPSTTKLWFDASHRLVRQEFVESGHQTIVQLVGVRRP